MSVTTLTESRTFGRALEYARDNVIPGIVQNAIDHLPGISLFAGRLGDIMFGTTNNQGRGKRVHTGGESLRARVRLGVNTSRGALASAYATFDTTPSDTVRHARGNWKLYGDTINLSQHELRMASGPEALGSILQEETSDGVSSLVDLVGQHLYDNTGVASRVTDMDTIVSANDSIFGLSGATYGPWNSRGVSARGTAAGSISFAGGSFATTGLSNWRIAWNNAWEGSVRPQAGLTTHDVYSFYEGSLQPQERFNSPRMADGGFETLQFKTAPILPDPHCNAGFTYFINFDFLKLEFLAGADFSVGRFVEPEAQDVIIAKVVATAELLCNGRKFQNKVTSQTA